jgi:hypothetical protein
MFSWIRHPISVVPEQILYYIDRHTYRFPISNILLSEPLTKTMNRGFAVSVIVEDITWIRAS